MESSALNSTEITTYSQTTNAPISTIDMEPLISPVNSPYGSDSSLSPRHFDLSLFGQTNIPTYYQKIPQSRETYLAYVVAIRDPLNLHLDIYWPSEVADRYSNAIHYDYTFISEELGNQICTRSAYSCHLRGVEIVSTSPNDFTNMKEAYILISKRIARSGGWVLVSLTDIDIYRRILINVFDIVTRQSLNQEFLTKISSRTGELIAKEYIRPLRSRPMFQPSSDSVPKDYHIVFNAPK